MGRSYVYNEMQRGDEQEVSLMIKRVFEKFVAPDYTSDGFTTFMQFINPNTLKNRNFRGNSVTLVCREEDKIVGVLEIQGGTHILLLFVAEEYHHQGIAKGLLNRAVEICRQKTGAGKITVNASPFGDPIYRKMGFMPTASQRVERGIKFTPMELVL